MRSLRYFFAAAAALATLPVAAQQPQLDSKPSTNTHMSVGLVAGTTGLGIDVSLTLNPMFRLRSGFSFMPRIEVPMTFDIQVGDDPSESAGKFERMSSMLESLTGNPVDDHVGMTGKATMWNWNLLVDIYPLKHNKHWRVTAGFFLGNSNAAEAFNQTESMPSLMAVDIYNNMYNKLHGKTVRELADVKLVDLGKGYEDVYTDINLLQKLQRRLDRNGRMGMHLGTYTHDVVDAEGNVIHKQGEDYVMEPDDHHMLKADMKVNAFKPYIGLGYDGRLVKGNDRLHIGVDAGLMLWGGKPKLITHDGTDLISDVEGLRGKVGSYVKLMSKLTVYPVASVRFSYTLF